MSATAFGAALISPEHPEWSRQIERLRLMRPSLVKIQIPPGFGTSAAQLEQMIDALPSVTHVLLRTEDGDPSYALTRQHLIGRGFVDLMRDRPALRWIVELGNEPDRVKSVPLGWFQTQAFQTVRRLREELAAEYGVTPAWTVALPTQLPLVQALFAGGEYERTCDCIGTHLYGFFHLLDPGLPTEWEHIWNWLLGNTRLPLYITEAGIDDPGTPMLEKARRYLSFLDAAPARLTGLALWAPVSTAQASGGAFVNYMLGDDALRLLGAREAEAMPLTINTPLLSTGTFTAFQSGTAVKSQSPRTPYTDFHVAEIVMRTLARCAEFGFNHDLVLSQMVHETNWFRFTGDVGPWQWNFAGLGATGGIPGHAFPDIAAGVLAVVAHHAVYRWGAKPNWPAHLQQYAGEHVDPRYDEVLSSGNAGRMIVLGDYRGTWAVPGTTYPESLVTRARQIAAFPGGGGAVALTDLIRTRIAAHGVEVHDIRAQMVRNGNYRRLPNTAWRNKGVHHTAANRPPGSLAMERDSWIGHSRFHVQTRGWPGIAYAIGISMSGRVFILRDIEEEGYHAFSANSSSIAICGDLTTSQTPTMADMAAALNAQIDGADPLELFPALDPYGLAPQDYAPASSGMLGSLAVVLHVLDNETPELPNLAHTRTYGHQELAFIDSQNAGTACPGSLLPFVRRYRTAGSTIENGDEMPPSAPSVIVQQGNPNGPLKIERGFAGHLWKLGWIAEPADPLAGILAQFGWVEIEEEATDFGSTIKLEKARWDWIKNAAGSVWEFQQRQVVEDVTDVEGVDPIRVGADMVTIIETGAEIIEQLPALVALVGLITDAAAELAELALQERAPAVAELAVLEHEH